eukprot:2360500-Pleurochrysis_carterae.AAC.2
MKLGRKRGWEQASKEGQEGGCGLGRKAGERVGASEQARAERGVGGHCTSRLLLDHIHYADKMRTLYQHAGAPNCLHVSLPKTIGRGGALCALWALLCPLYYTTIQSTASK